MQPTQRSNGFAQPPARVEPDAHGQAALLLAESTLHTLVTKGVLTHAEAVDVIRSAADVKEEVAMAAGESEARMQASLRLLNRMASSIGSDFDERAHEPVSIARQASR